jgi:hypothetical protein
MNIEDFVKTVLQQIVNAVEKDSALDDSFYITTKGIDFDLAVTTVVSDTTTNSKSGEAKIKVLGGGILKGKESKESSEIASRIQFTVGKYSKSHVG